MPVTTPGASGAAVTGKAPVVRRFPMIAGIDFAGTVESSSNPNWKPGDKVIANGWGMGETHLGAYAEKARVRGDWLVRLPDGMTARQAVMWFLSDMAEVSGFAISGFKRTEEMRSMYPVYRPMLTSPDPWYYAGTVALEASKIADLFPPDESDAVLREVIEQVDGVIGRKNKDVSTLAFLLLGRLGLGAVLMRRRVPDDMLGKIMMILIGSESEAAPRMPSPETYEQLRKALKECLAEVKNGRTAVLNVSLVK